MERLICPVLCREVTDRHLDYFSFDVEGWLSKPENYALIEGANIAFGEFKSPGVYHVHFCFDTAKGRDAIELTRRMFRAFCEACPVEVAVGLIAVDNKKAKWLIRQVGFKSLGEIMTENGMCEMFYATKDLNNGIV